MAINLILVPDNLLLSFLMLFYLLADKLLTTHYFGILYCLFYLLFINHKFLS